MIPVKNIYWMLSYAFTSLQSKGYADLSSDVFENAADLLAAILSRGINQQVKRGLRKDYRQKGDALYSPKGKIDITSSIKGDSLMRHQLVCAYDEFTLNCYMNQVLKTAGTILMKKNLSKDHQKTLRRSLEYLTQVATLNPHRIQWNQHYDRNSATYRMLMSLCRLVVDGCIHSKEADGRRLEDFDEKTMSALFERFILEYFRKEHGGELTANAPHIPWAVDNGVSDMLPEMRTDVTLETKVGHLHRVLIIDAKYYAHTLQSRFEKRTVHSNNLYQIFTYVKNRSEFERQVGSDFVVAGMILYAGTNEEIQPNTCYQMSGNEISVTTLNLDCDFDVIRKQLDDIAVQLMSLEKLSGSAGEYALIKPLRQRVCRSSSLGLQGS